MGGGQAQFKSLGSFLDPMGQTEGNEKLGLGLVDEVQC